MHPQNRQRHTIRSKFGYSERCKLLKVQADVLQFKLLTIEEGRKLNRFKAGSKGMAKPIVRRYSHIKIVLVEKAQPKKTEKKSEKKEK